MTVVQDALKLQLQSLAAVLAQIDNNIYCHQSNWLSGASIGQHTRHVIELVQCLVNGYEAGMVNYDNRERDQHIENNKTHAITCINELAAQIVKPDKALLLEGSFDTEAPLPVQINSTYNRELVYNIEHAVHHMALIKVALKEQAINYISEDFGVAYATIQHRKLCAQ